MLVVAALVLGGLGVGSAVESPPEPEAPDVETPTAPEAVCHDAVTTPGVATGEQQIGPITVASVPIVDGAEHVPATCADVPDADPDVGPVPDPDPNPDPAPNPDPIDTRCDLVSCSLLRLDDDDSPGNVIALEQGDDLPASDLWWGSTAIWTARNMGTGSGLDADLLDGLSATAFALAGHDHDGVYLGVGDTAVNAERLDGLDATDFARAAHHHDGVYLSVGATAANAALLDGLDSSDFALAGHLHDARYYTQSAADARFLGINAKAVDADKLDGRDVTEFATANHLHDGRYFTQGEADARFLAIAGKAADAHKLDGLDSTAFATSGHLHDDRYFTESEANSRFLGINAKAADANLLDGQDSSAFALAAHLHDDRYFTESEANGRFLGINAKAADANLLDGQDSSAFALAAHLHDDRYFTESEANSRFLLKGETATNADRVDGLHGSQLLRRDTSDTMSGNFRATGTVRGDNGVCLGGDCRNAWPDPANLLRSTNGKHFAFPITGGGNCILQIGYGSSSCPVQPYVMPGSTHPTYDDSGYLPDNTIVRYDFSLFMGGEPYCCITNNGAPVVYGGGLYVYKYGPDDQLHPQKLRLQYINDVNGQWTHRDWTTYPNGQISVLELEFKIKGVSSQCTSCRVVELTARLNGGSAFTIDDMRLSLGQSLIYQMYSASSFYNFHHVYGAAGEIIYP